MSKILKFFKNNLVALSIIGLGVSLRLIVSFFQNHNFDFLNIIVLVKSVADTNDLIEGFFVIKKAMNYEVQLYGKIFYQVAAIWLKFLDYIGIVNIDYIFDTKPYRKSYEYMDAFLQWGPLHYQLTAIKLIQFIYDFLLLTYLIKIGQILFNNRFKIAIIVFWAFNPLIIYTTYVLFQSDLAMTAFLTAGVYYGILAIKKPSYNFISLNIFLMLTMFAIGAVIKQVPLLFVIPFLIVLSKNLKDFLKGLLVFATLYVLFSQPWAKDISIVKEFHLTSPESMALFNFSLNSVPIFLLLYSFFIIFTFYNRDKIIATPIKLILISSLILTIVYISEDLNFLFVQFNIWILPFIAFLTLHKKKYAIFFIAPLIGFFKRAIVDNDVMIGSFGVTLGLPLNHTPKYNDIIEKFLNPMLIHYLFSTTFIVACVILLYVLYKDIIDKEDFFSSLINKNIKLNLIKISISVFSIFFIIFTLDFFYRSQFVNLTKFVIKNETKTILSGTIFKFTINNPQRRDVSAILVPISRQEINTNGYTYFNFYDLKNNKLLFNVKVNDYTFATDNSYTRVMLPSKINLEKISVEIDKQKDPINKLIIHTTDDLIISKDFGHSSGYDNFYSNQKITIDYNNYKAPINILGQYWLEDMLTNIIHNIKQRPSFYFVYISTTLLALFISSVITIRATINVYRIRH